MRAISAATDPIRHALAGLLAAAVFLGLFFGAALDPAVAAAVAAGAYLATFLIAARRPPRQAERMLTPDVSESDLDAALAAFRNASARLQAIESRAPVEVGDAIEEMAARLRRIADLHEKDPRDLKHTRNFVRHDLERMVETCERFVDLAALSDPTDGKRLSPIGERIRAFAPALAKIEQACMENDFLRLEVEAEVLSGQIGR